MLYVGKWRSGLNFLNGVRRGRSGGRKSQGDDVKRTMLYSCFGSQGEDDQAVILDGHSHGPSLVGYDTGNSGRPPGNGVVFSRLIWDRGTSMSRLFTSEGATARALHRLGLGRPCGQQQQRHGAKLVQRKEPGVGWSTLDGQRGL